MKNRWMPVFLLCIAFGLPARAQTKCWLNEIRLIYAAPRTLMGGLFDSRFRVHTRGQPPDVRVGILHTFDPYWQPPRQDITWLTAKGTYDEGRPEAYTVWEGLASSSPQTNEIPGWFLESEPYWDFLLVYVKNGRTNYLDNTGAPFSIRSHDPELGGVVGGKVGLLQGFSQGTIRRVGTSPSYYALYYNLTVDVAAQAIPFSSAPLYDRWYSKDKLVGIRVSTDGGQRWREYYGRPQYLLYPDGAVLVEKWVVQGPEIPASKFKGFLFDVFSVDTQGISDPRNPVAQEWVDSNFGRHYVVDKKNLLISGYYD